MKCNQILTAVLLVLLLTLCCTVFACAAEIRPIPVDHDSLDQGNGEFRLSFRNTSRIGSGGYFIAVLYLQDHYRADEILSSGVVNEPGPKLKPPSEKPVATIEFE